MVLNLVAASGDRVHVQSATFLRGSARSTPERGSEDAKPSEGPLISKGLSRHAKNADPAENLLPKKEFPVTNSISENSTKPFCGKLMVTAIAYKNHLKKFISTKFNVCNYMTIVKTVKSYVS